MDIVFSNGIMSENDEKLVLVSLLGIIAALKDNSLTIDEAEKFLFSPHMVNKLQIGKCNKKIINIIEKGCELEQETLEILKEYPRYNKTFWIDR